MNIDYVVIVSAIIGTGVLLLVLILLSLRGWIKSSPKARKALFAYFDLQDYHNLVRDTFLTLHESRGKIQDILKSSVGKDHKDVTRAFIESYKEIDEVMDRYLRAQKELEEKLFPQDRVEKE